MDLNWVGTKVEENMGNENNVERERVQGETAKIRRASWEWCGNLVKWKPPDMYESDPNEYS